MNIATMSNLSGISNSVSIVSQVIIAVGVIVGFWQFFKTMRFKKIEKAVELAKYYKEYILINNSKIVDIYTKHGMLNEADSFRKNCLEFFDYRDAKKYGYYRFLSIIDLNTDENDLSLISDTLNNLEYFAMNFNRKLASEKAIYQSIHQSYIKFVELLYVYVCYANLTENDDLKYYTNIVELYDTWKIKSEKRKSQFDKLKREAVAKKYNNEKLKSKKMDKILYDASNA